MSQSGIVFPLGATFGFVVGAVALAPVAVLVAEYADLGERTLWTLAAFSVGMGGTGGAVIGGTRDILAYLHRALPVRPGPDADYREPGPRAGPRDR